MRRKQRYYLILVLIASAIITLSHANAQNDQQVIIGLKEKFSNYVRSFPREEVYVHTDREEYIAGEVAFLTSYIIDRQTYKASLNSRIIYLELLNSANIPVIQRKFIADNGSGPGSLELPDTLSTGVYRLIAYTSWMKNFLPENYFYKEISIFNLLKDDKIRISRSISATESNRLPEYMNTDVAFSVNRDLKDSIILDISFKRHIGNALYLIIQNHGNIIYEGSYPVHTNRVRKSLPASVLTPGINQLTLFSESGKPVSERFLYGPFRPSVISIQSNDTVGIREKINVNFSAPVNKLNSGCFSISVSPGLISSTSLAEYMITGTEFGISYPAISAGAEISDISVRYADSVLSNVSSNWINWKHITESSFPECKYPVERDYHYLMGALNTEEDMQEQPDFIFMCSPGRDAYFRYAVCDEKGRFSIAMESDNELIDYVIMPEEMNSQVVIESPFITNLKSIALPGDTATEMPGYIPEWSINYQVNKLYEIKDTSLSHPERSRSHPERSRSHPERSRRAPTRFYGKPDIELVMDDYISLPVMEEVFFEILPNVSIRKIESKREIIITDRVNNMPYQSVPCLMIDGVIIGSAELIIDLDPELVEKIDVIREKYIVGKYVFPGIVNVITRKADLSAIELPAYMNRFSYTVSDIPELFSSPDHEKSGRRIPDYRNTLYWNPLLIAEDEATPVISFTSSDNYGEYAIIIQGVTKDGELVSGRKALKVIR